MEWNSFSNFGTDRNISVKSYGDQSIGLQENGHFKVFFSIFSSGSHPVQWSGTFIAILVQGPKINV